MTVGIYGYWDNLKDEMVYIGQSVNIQKRLHAHVEPGRYDDQKINKILQSNPDRYTPHILKECDINSLDYWEITLIALYNPKFNFAIGGKVNRGYHLSKETKRKLSEANSGENNYWYGKKFSEEHKRKLSESHKGYVPSEETKKKLSIANKGKSISDEHKQRLREVNTGKKLSEEIKMKFREKRNTTGFYNVHREKTPQRKKGFTLRYTYYDKKGKRKRISSVSIFKLKQKVLEKGLLWKITNETLARQTIQNEIGV